MYMWENTVPVFKCPSCLKGKTPSHSAMNFFKFLHLFVLKVCTGMKDCVKFNFGQNYR